MKIKTLLILLWLALGGVRLHAAPLGSAIPYQGRLTDNNAAASGSFDMQWALFDALTGGAQRGSKLTSLAVPVTNGLFNVALPFRDTVFDGTALFLEIEVRPTGSDGDFIPLAPRQAILPTAYALTALKANNVTSGAIGTAQLADGSVTPAKLAGVLDHLSARDGSPDNAVQVDNNGNVGIGTLTPNTKLDVRGNLMLEAGGNPSIFTGSGVLELNRYIALLNSPNNQTASGLKAGGVLISDSYAYANPGKNDLIVKGKVGVGTSAPGHPLHVEGGSAYFGNVGDGAVLMYLATERHWQLRQLGTGAGTSLELASVGGGGNKNFVISTTGTVGIGTTGPGADLAVNGTTTTKILSITGGSDLSERFDIAAPGGALEPGMVVCIDPANPGKLVRSSKAFDRTVAGVISGANGVATGMVMGQAGTVADGKYPVALTGRVYVHADASTAPIQPGDLLTTSDTPGHCQAVTDNAAATGAILGKAMTGLADGKGLVLVLVSLQ